MSGKSHRPPNTVVNTSQSQGGTDLGPGDSNSDVLADVTPQTDSCAGNTPTLDAVEDKTRRETYLRVAQDVVTQSNEAGENDPMWHAFNGGNRGVLKDDPNASKPEAWLRGLTLKDAGSQTDGLQDYTVGSVHGDTNGIDTIAEFRQMLQSDLKFNDAFTKFPNEDKWIEALLEQYCKDLPADDPERAKVKAIGHNLWCYQTTGADANGKTDIAQFQGMLYALDSLLAEASQSNTKHKGTFTIPGTDIELDTLGDGIYGRATELEARLLAAIVQVPKDEIPRKDEDPKEYDESVLLVDASGTMYDQYEKLGKLMDEVDFGTTTLGAFADYGADLGNGDSFRLSPDGPQDSDDVRKKLDTMSQAARDAGSEIGGTRGAVSGVDPAFDLEAGARESSIHSALQLLRDDQRFPWPPLVPPRKRQIVVATDEKDCRPDELGTLRDLANDKEVAVKVVYMLSTGMFVISVNAVDDDTIALLGHVPKAQKDGLLTEGVPAEEQSNHPDQDYLRLDWKEIAKRQGVEKTPYD